MLTEVAVTEQATALSLQAALCLLPSPWKRSGQAHGASGLSTAAMTLPFISFHPKRYEKLKDGTVRTR